MEQLGAFFTNLDKEAVDDFFVSLQDAFHKLYMAILFLLGAAKIV